MRCSSMAASLRRPATTCAGHCASWRATLYSTKSGKGKSDSPAAKAEHSPPSSEQQAATAKKSIAEMDKELHEKLANRSGDGGSAGIEYEDGKPVAMKRSVKNNMFRYI